MCSFFRLQQNKNLLYSKFLNDGVKICDGVKRL